ncbi:MAG: hypothetical protein LKE85_04245 [Lachnospiraceae bacterium]|nr:hypothetical protein [Lachnospiraceae bacterium]
MSIYTSDWEVLNLSTSACRVSPSPPVQLFQKTTFVAFGLEGSAFSVVLSAAASVSVSAAASVAAAVPAVVLEVLPEEPEELLPHPATAHAAIAAVSSTTSLFFIFLPSFFAASVTATPGFWF